MRAASLVCAILLIGISSSSRDSRTVAPVPDQFEIGRRTFWDFGPPFNYYDLFFVRPNGEGAAVERVILTPPADECSAPAKVEFASAQLKDPPPSLLGSMNPCSIPEKELKRKPKDCTHRQHFSGADIVLRVRCGTQVRVIPAHIFEDYWFNPASKAPKVTTTLMELTKRLDDAVGPGVMEKPVFEVSNSSESPQLPPDSPDHRALGAGEFDGLFAWSRDRLSDLYHSSQKFPPSPTVRLLSTAPYEPESVILPNYPPIALAARIEGQVTFEANIDSSGTPSNIVFVNGHRLLTAAVQYALNSWKFTKEADNRQIHGTFEFLLNCHSHQP